MIAYHWLRSDLTTGAGNEPAWALGETRRLKGKLVLCSYGYHHSPTLFDGLEYALGAIACRVDVNKSGLEPTIPRAVLPPYTFAYADATVRPKHVHAPSPACDTHPRVAHSNSGEEQRRRHTRRDAAHH